MWTGCGLRVVLHRERRDVVGPQTLHHVVVEADVADLDPAELGLADPVEGRVEVSHVCLNDNVVEGLQLLDQPAFSVQYHPEAAAGPHDAAYLFDRFTSLMSTVLMEGQRA